MTIPVPFPINPGDRLRVTTDKPHGTDLLPGDLVTAIHVGVRLHDGRPVPVVQVATALGPRMLTFFDVEPAPALPSIAPAEPDEIVDAQFFNILGADGELRDWAVIARQELAANDAKEAPAADAEDAPEAPPRTVGDIYSFEDSEGDLIEVTYCEQDCPNHGREGGFHFAINEDQEVVIPADAVDPLIRFLFTMRNHSRRPGGE